MNTNKKKYSFWYLWEGGEQDGQMFPADYVVGGEKTNLCKIEWFTQDDMLTHFTELVDYYKYDSSNSAPEGCAIGVFVTEYNKGDECCIGEMKEVCTAIWDREDWNFRYPLPC